MYISVARKSQRDDLQEKGTFRLCALGAIDKADIEAFFRVLKEALAELGMILPKERKRRRRAMRGGRRRFIAGLQPWG